MFDPVLTESLPSAVRDLLSVIESSDAVVICAPEYIFSIPARLKNLLEWCVATTIFSDKPVGLITASADGKQGHAQLKLIMQTLGARLSENAELIIPGIKGKFDQSKQLTDPQVASELSRFADALIELLTIKD
jgi:chromate reductase